MGDVRFVGMDVHKESIVIAVADGDRTAPQVVREIPNDIATKRVQRVSRSRVGFRKRGSTASWWLRR